MPRPSLKEERKAEILDAYGRCIARHGVEGTTLEMTADEAGLARALIRHNVGNKDDILDAFVDRFLSGSTSEADDLFESLPENERIEVMIKWLFDPRYTDSQNVSVSNALFTAARERPTLSKRLLQWTAEFTGKIERELRDAYPDSEDRIEAVATGIVAIYFNFETLAPMGDAARLRATSETAARLLVSALER